jgi:hypothetical protein
MQKIEAKLVTRLWSSTWSTPSVNGDSTESRRTVTSVSPSLRAGGEVYNPRTEVARGYLAIALSSLLINPPTQGRKLLE